MKTDATLRTQSHCFCLLWLTLACIYSCLEQQQRLLRYLCLMPQPTLPNSILRRHINQPYTLFDAACAALYCPLYCRSSSSTILLQLQRLQPCTAVPQPPPGSFVLHMQRVLRPLPLPRPAQLPLLADAHSDHVQLADALTRQLLHGQGCASVGALHLFLAAWCDIVLPLFLLLLAGSGRLSSKYGGLCACRDPCICSSSSKDSMLRLTQKTPTVKPHLPTAALAR